MNTVLISGLISGLVSGLAVLADKVPSEDEIGAGWIYAVVFVLLAGAVVFLGFSLTKHLRKARTNADSGAFGKPDDTPR
jgi:hypothetical protein